MPNRLRSKPFHNPVAYTGLCLAALFPVLYNFIEPSLLADLLSAFLTAGAFGVLVAYGPGMFVVLKYGQQGRTTAQVSGELLILGVCSAWIGREGSTGWGWAFRAMDLPPWMPIHWFPLLMTYMTLIGAGLHLRADAVDSKLPRKTWVERGIACFAVLAVGLGIVVWVRPQGGFGG
jgi:hypothetical protein